MLTLTHPRLFFVFIVFRTTFTFKKGIFQRVTFVPSGCTYTLLFYSIQNLQRSSLVHTLQSKKYIYIGEEIFQFTAVAPVVLYQSPLGNNDTPYPYALDTKGHAYLMIEKVYLIANTFDSKDPYASYYSRKCKFLPLKGLKVIDIPAA